MIEFNTIINCFGLTYKIIFDYSFYSFWTCYIKIYFNNSCIMNVNYSDKNKLEAEKKCYKKATEEILTVLNSNFLITEDISNFCYCSLYETDNWKDELYSIKAAAELLNNGLSGYVDVSQSYKNEIIDKAKIMSQKFTIFKKNIDDRIVILAIVYLKKSYEICGSFGVDKNVDIAIKKALHSILSTDYIAKETERDIKSLYYNVSRNINAPFLITISVMTPKNNLDIIYDFNNLQKTEKKISNIKYYCYKLKQDNINPQYLKIKNKILNKYNFGAYIEEWNMLKNDNNILSNDNVNFSKTLISLFDMKSTIAELDNITLQNILNNDECVYYLDCDIYVNQIKKFQFISNYIFSNKYTLNEISDLAKHFNIIISQEDLLNYKNREYLINKIFYETFYHTYNSPKYKNIINLINGDNR